MTGSLRLVFESEEAGDFIRQPASGLRRHSMLAIMRLKFDRGDFPEVPYNPESAVPVFS